MCGGAGVPSRTGRLLTLPSSSAGGAWRSSASVMETAIDDDGERAGGGKALAGWHWLGECAVAAAGDIDAARAYCSAVLGLLQRSDCRKPVAIRGRCA